MKPKRLKSWTRPSIRASICLIRPMPIPAASKAIKEIKPAPYLKYLVKLFTELISDSFEKISKLLSSPGLTFLITLITLVIFSTHAS